MELKIKQTLIVLNATKKLTDKIQKANNKKVDLDILDELIEFWQAELLKI